METMDAVVHARPESLGSRRKDLPSEFLAIVEKALRKEPDERYQHMSDLAADLRHFKRTTDSDLVPPTTRRRRSSVPKALGMVGALAVVAVVVWIVRARRRKPTVLVTRWPDARLPERRRHLLAARGRRP